MLAVVRRRRRAPAVSICSLTNEPPERVAASLEPLAALEAEVVLAVDDRMPAAFDPGYRRVADRVIRVPFPGAFSRLYGWLAAQCSAGWILQLDADEVPGAGLAGGVREVIADRELTHAWVPRRWLWPDGEHALAEWPWRPAYTLRLLRNDPAVARFPGRLHEPVQATGPRRFLAEPIYHAHLLLRTEEERRRSCARYEAGRPGMLMDGRPFNEAWYLPELRDGPRTAPVPDGDRSVVERFLAPPPLRGATRAPGVERASAEEVVADWPLRPVPESAYRARLRAREDHPVFVAGSVRTLDVEVANLGTETWPWGWDAQPAIRLACRWRHPSGAVAVPEGLRTPFPAPLRPGARALVPVEVLAPPAPGRYILEVDVVHEHVRWFGCELRVGARVEPGAGVPAPVRASA